MALKFTALDSLTLDIVASLVAALLGTMLLVFARRENTPALRWWGAAYLLGAVSVALWTLVGNRFGDVVPQLLSAIGLIACALVWSAARVFHGKQPKLAGMALGAVVWISAGMLLEPDALALRLTLGAGLIAVYAMLTAAELLQERRKDLKRRWPALVIPVLHGFVLLLPILLGNLLRGADGAFGGAWVTIFSIELVLYAVGTVFVIVMLVSERIVAAHKRAASIDPLTGLFNRRGFAEACAEATREAEATHPVTVLIFDLDHFKSINDRFGHPAGDEILKLFAAVMVGNLRLTDLSGRIGGEEFAAFLSCSLNEGVLIAERVREVFSTSGAICDDTPVETTVSVGVSSGPVGIDLDVLLVAADTALYDAKRAGRDRVAAATEVPFTPDRVRHRASRRVASRARPSVAAT